MSHITHEWVTSHMSAGHGTTSAMGFWLIVRALSQPRCVSLQKSSVSPQRVLYFRKRALHHRKWALYRCKRAQHKSALHFRQRVLYYLFRTNHKRRLTTKVCITAKAPYISAGEPYISAKEPYISANEPYISTFSDWRCRISNKWVTSHTCVGRTITRQQYNLRFAVRR